MYEYEFQKIICCIHIRIFWSEFKIVIDYNLADRFRFRLGPPGYPGTKGDKGDRGDSVSKISHSHINY